MEALLFYIFGGLAVVMVVFMILKTNPVTCALSLVVAFFGLSGLYILLDAPFVAALQILVYAGAIMVLFIFVIMFLNLTPEELKEDRVTRPRLVAGLVLFLSTLGLAVKYLDWQTLSFQPAPEGFGEAAPVGRLMFTEYLVPFEIVSILLLVAIVGVFVLGRREGE